MRHLKAREIIVDGSKTGLYHYTESGKRTGVLPIGFCATDCPGHPTEEEACDHYKEYLLAKTLLSVEMLDYRRCTVPLCRKLTLKAIELDDHLFILCGTHRTKEVVSSLLKVGESWVS